MSVGDPTRRCPRIPRRLHEQLLAVEPSVDSWVIGNTLEYRPCRVALEDGSVRDRVYVQDAKPWITVWDVWPDEDPGKHELRIEDVVAIEESPARIPPHLATRMYEAGESGMGYCRFTLELADGRQLACVTGNAVDFVALPSDASASDIVDLIPGGRAGDPCDGADYAWCMYELPPLD